MVKNIVIERIEAHFYSILTIFSLHQNRKECLLERGRILENGSYDKWFSLNHGKSL